MEILNIFVESAVHILLQLFFYGFGFLTLAGIAAYCITQGPPEFSKEMYTRLNKNAWGRAILLSILTTWAFQILAWFLPYLRFSPSIGDIPPFYRMTSFAPWTLHMLWLLAALLLVLWVLLNMLVRMTSFIGVLFLIFITSIFFSTLHERLNIDRYCGVKHIYKWDTDYQDYEYASIDTYLDSLFPCDCQELDFYISNLKRTEGYDDESLDASTSFAFWQTGLAYGFPPDSDTIPLYGEFSGTTKRIFLILTVGPVVLLECLIRGMVYYFVPLLIAQLIFFGVTKEHIWWTTIKGIHFETHFEGDADS